MPKGHGFPVASKILKRDDQDRAFKLHRQRMQNISSKLDNSPPRRYPHLVLRLKQTQMEEEYLANVDYENKMLLHKMVRIMEKPRNGMDNWNDYETKSLNAPYKSKREVRIEQENLAMARRLEAVRPMYSTGKWEEEHRRYKYLQDMWSDSTKDYTPRGRGRDRHSVNGSKADDDQYEDDFESDDETGREGENGRLPDIKQDKDNRDTRRSKSDSSVQRLPKIQNKKQNPKLYMYWGKYFNADFEESEDGKPSQAEQDAKQLFRVAKTLVPPTDIMVRTLIRRTPKQRDIIKKKFHELYELDLTSELKNGLGKQWHLLIESLLPASRDNDDGGDVHNGKEDDDDGPESALQSALQKGDIATVVAIIASKTDKDLADLKDSYDRKHGTTLENDIKARTQDPEQLFLVNLTKENKSGGKKDVVQREATAIFEQENERWTSPDGEFMKVVERRTPAHVKAVLKKYEEVSGTSALKAIKQECSKNYADAVAALLSDSSKGEELGTQGMNHAIVMYKNLNAENPTFVNLLVERAEIDMPTVRKAYSKKYKSEMHVDLDDRSRHPTVRCLVELILKVPPGKEKEQDKHGSQQKRSKSEYRKGSQEGNQGQGQNKDSPFGKNSRRAMAESRKEQPKKKKSGEDNAEKLHNAIQKKQLTAKLTLDVLLEGNNAKRQALKKKYKEKYKTDLAEDLKKELSGDDLEDVVVGLLMSPTEYDAYCLNKAVMGLGTNEDVLIGILCTASPKELKSIKETYKKNYGEDLDSAIKGDTSGGFEDMLLALSRGEREQGTNVNDKQAKEVAQKLAKNKTLDMDDPTFTELMTKTNKEQLKATFREYKKVSGKSMEQAIKSASSGDKEDGYLGLLAATDDPVTFYADSLQKACKGAGTNDDQLMRIVISRSEVDLPAIKAKFKDRHKRPLRQAIEDETSGEYRDALLKIVDKT